MNVGHLTLVSTYKGDSRGTGEIVNWTSTVLRTLCEGMIVAGTSRTGRSDRIKGEISWRGIIIPSNFYFSSAQVWPGFRYSPPPPPNQNRSCM